MGISKSESKIKKYALLLCILVLSCCAKQHGSGIQSVSDNSEIQIVPTVEISLAEQGDEKPLLIGGKQYNFRYRLEPPDSKALTLGDIDDIEILILYIDPLDSWRINSLEGIDQLYNAKNLYRIRVDVKNLDTLDLSVLEGFPNITELDISINASSRVLPDLAVFKSLSVLSIREVIFEQPYTLYAPSGLTSLNIEGTNMHLVDLSVIETLHDLHGLRLAGDITRLPDLTGLENLRSISVGGSLESFVGIGAPNLRGILIGSTKDIDSLSPLNNLLFLERLTISLPRKKEYKIADMANLPSLKYFELYIGKIDLQGIENMSALEKLWLDNSQPFNIEGIGRLTNLKELLLNVTSPAPSLRFLEGMPNLAVLYLDADRWVNGTSRGFPDDEPEAYQVLDVSPLATLHNLQSLACRNFIIRNISSLDVLDALSEGDEGYIGLVGCRLYDATEKSRHQLVFEFHRH
jgi:hypothetical protein